MTDICYLCGLPITASQVRSDDHVIPATLIRRDQPRAKGFDFGHYLSTHEKCNNEFGPETYVAKGLDFLSILNEPTLGSPLQLRAHPDITILPLDSTNFSHFTRRDLTFFKMIDAREFDVSELSDPDFYTGRVKTNPIRDVLPVVLSVLAKSAAALLVKRHLQELPDFWRIYAHPYTGDLSQFDLSELLGESKPFDKELRVWVVELPNSNWHVIYAAKDTLVYLTFAFNDRRRLLRELKTTHAGAHTFNFTGKCINELLVVGWHEV